MSLLGGGKHSRAGPNEKSLGHWGHDSEGICKTPVSFSFGFWSQDRQLCCTAGSLFYCADHKKWGQLITGRNFQNCELQETFLLSKLIISGYSNAKLPNRDTFSNPCLKQEAVTPDSNDRVFL